MELTRMEKQKGNPRETANQEAMEAGDEQEDEEEGEPQLQLHFDLPYALYFSTPFQDLLGVNSMIKGRLNE
jgi:hypothetical protein